MHVLKLRISMFALTSVVICCTKSVIKNQSGVRREAPILFRERWREALQQKYRPGRRRSSNRIYHDGCWRQHTEDKLVSRYGVACDAERERVCLGLPTTDVTEL